MKVLRFLWPLVPSFVAGTIIAQGIMFFIKNCREPTCEFTHDEYVEECFGKWPEEIKPKYRKGCEEAKKGCWFKKPNKK